MVNALAYFLSTDFDYELWESFLNDELDIVNRKIVKPILIRPIKNFVLFTENCATTLSYKASFFC
jgi:hypothetical protein